MIYLEYERLLNAQKRTIERYQAVLDQEAELFDRTQPQGTDYGTERVQASAVSTAIDRYIEAKDKLRIDQRKAELVEAMEEWEDLIESKKNELYVSQSREDKVYRMRAIENRKVAEIAQKLHYSPESIYRTLRMIRKKIKDDKK